MKDLDTFPLYEMQTLYYQFWKEKEADKKLTDEQRAGAAISAALEEQM